MLGIISNMGTVRSTHVLTENIKSFCNSVTRRLNTFCNSSLPTIEGCLSILITTNPRLRGVVVVVAYDCGCSNTLLLLTRIDKIGQLEISSI